MPSRKGRPGTRDHSIVPIPVPVTPASSLQDGHPIHSPTPQSSFQKTEKKDKRTNRPRPRWRSTPQTPSSSSPPWSGTRAPARQWYHRGWRGRTLAARQQHAHQDERGSVGYENLLNSTGEGSARTPFLVLHAHMSQVFPASHSQPWQPWGYGMTSFSSSMLVELEAVSKGGNSVLKTRGRGKKEKHGRGGRCHLPLEGGRGKGRLTPWTEAGHRGHRRRCTHSGSTRCRRSPCRRGARTGT